METDMSTIYRAQLTSRRERFLASKWSFATAGLALGLLAGAAVTHKHYQLEDSHRDKQMVEVANTRHTNLIIERKLIAHAREPNHHRANCLLASDFYAAKGLTPR